MDDKSECYGYQGGYAHSNEYRNVGVRKTDGKVFGNTHHGSTRKKCIQALFGGSKNCARNTMIIIYEEHDTCQEQTTRQSHFGIKIFVVSQLIFIRTRAHTDVFLLIADQERRYNPLNREMISI